MKRLFLLSVIIYASYVGAYDFEIDGICYTVSSFENYTVSVDGLDDSMSGTIDIPSTITYSGKVFSVTGIKSLKSSKIEFVNIPSSVKSIGDDAFSFSSIKKIDIPDNVTSIGSGAFYGCKELETVKVSNNVTELKSTFGECYKLTQIDWNPQTKDGRLSGGVFFYCKSLKTFRIPSGVSPSGIDGDYYLDNFIRCESLDSIIIEDGENNPIRFSYGEFQESPLKHLYIGRPVSSGANKYFSYIESIEIGDNVTELTDWFLYDSWGIDDPSKLKRLVIGSSLKNVRDFSSNEQLEFIKIKNKVPPIASGFSNYNYINTILYVPKGTKSVYESSDIWKYFWNIQEYEVDGGKIDIKKCASPTISYSNGKLNFACETEDVTCQASITDADIRTYSGNEIQLGVTYNINVYATKPGYENSDVVTATLCWIDTEPKTEGFDNSVAQVRANAVLILTENGQISISGVDDGAKISVYGVNGLQVGSATSRNGHANITTNLLSGSIAIIKIGNRSVKTTIR